MKKLILTVAATGVLSSPFGCVRNPVTGRRQVVLVSETQEIAMGRESDPQVRQEYGIADGVALQNYVETVGRKLVKVSHRPNLEWHFAVVDSPVVNAFAIPGGYVYVTRGLLAYLTNEAELAGVMGHEVGHVTARHSVRQITREQLAQIGLGVGGALSPVLGQFGNVAQSGLGLVFLRFSRDDEREADLLGIEYAARAAYDPRQVGNFFDVLGHLSAAGDRQTIPGWLSTHPDPPERVQATRKEAEQWIETLGLTDECMATNRDEFLRSLDGMVFGANPREGFSEGRWFYHPALRFQIEFPVDWRIDNTREAVIATESRQEARLQLTMANVRRGTRASEYVRFLASRGLAPDSARDLRIHGFNAVLASYGAAMAAFIEFRDGITQIVGVASDRQRFAATFERTIESFDSVTDERILNAQPDRLRLYTAEKEDTLTLLAQRFANPRASADDLAVLNRMATDQAISPGRLVKVVEKGY
jgi:predicted Zn-dependent protease